MACEFYIRCYQDVLCTPLIKSFRYVDYVGNFDFFFIVSVHIYVKKVVYFHICAPEIHCTKVDAI